MPPAYFSHARKSNLLLIAAFLLPILPAAAMAEGIIIIAAGVDDAVVSATDFGAIPDDGQDDGANIQAAADSLDGSAKGGIVFLPAGDYISASREIALPLGVSLVGEGWREGFPSNGRGTSLRRTGSVGTLINPADVSKLMISGLMLTSTGHCVDMSTTLSSSLSNLGLAPGEGYWGIYAEENTFGNNYTNITTFGTNMACNGVMLCGHTRLETLEASGMNEAVRITAGPGVVFDSGRLEVNNKAVVTGLNYDDSAIGSNSFTVCNLTMESNKIAFDINSAANATFKNIHASGVTGSYPTGSASNGGDGTAAIDIGTMSGTSWENAIFSGYFPNRTAINWGDVYGCRFVNMTVANSAASGQDWPPAASVLNVTKGNTWDLTDLINNTSDTVTADLIRNSLRTHGLAQIDFLNPVKQGKNLRGINIAVSEGATTKAVAFRGGASGGTVNFSSLTAANTGGATLPAATYYYFPTAVTSAGEAAGSPEASAVVGGANNSVQIVCNSLTAPVKYRIYRGTTTGGPYSGCYELALNTFTYTDTNAALTFPGAQPPVSGVHDNSMQEPDATYAVVVTPSWLTTWRVTSKATTGFTVDFGTAAPVSATIDYMIVR